MTKRLAMLAKAAGPVPANVYRSPRSVPDYGTGGNFGAPSSSSAADIFFPPRQLNDSGSPPSERPSVAVLEAARLALMRHFLCLEELLPRQGFCHDVAAFGCQLGVPVSGYRR